MPPFRLEYILCIWDFTRTKLPQQTTQRLVRALLREVLKWDVLRSMVRCL